MDNDIQPDQKNESPEIEVRLNPLPEDNDTPFSPPTDRTDEPMMESRGEGDNLDPTHQATDTATDIDSHELYDEGSSGAIEANELNAENAVTDYSPQDDSTRQE